MFGLILSVPKVEGWRLGDSSIKRWCATLGAMVLSLILQQPNAFAAVIGNDFCNTQLGPPTVLCPGSLSSVLVSSDFKQSFDESSTGGNKIVSSQSLFDGEVVFCDGFALNPGFGLGGSGTGCDSMGISDILRFLPDPDSQGEIVTWLSDGTNEGSGEAGKPDSSGDNGADGTNGLLKPSSSNVFYYTESSLIGGVETNTYTAVGLTFHKVTYTLQSDNPEPRTLLLVATGGLLMLVPRVRKWTSGRG